MGKLPGLVLLLGSSLFAQLTSTTSLVGRVADSAGAEIQGAAVKAINTATSETLSAVTNSEGQYEFLFIKPGTYSITVQQSGFDTSTLTGIPVSTNQVVRNDFTMKIGQVSEQISVTADIPPINTEDASITETLSTKSTAELPLNSRNALRLAITVPMVLPGRKTPTGNPGGGEGYIGAGTREIQNSLSMDGVSIMNNLITTSTLRPSVDAIQEFQVQTGTYPAQYGGYMGVQLNVITKSGTNQLHGTAFEFLRNDALDAKNFFQRADTKKAPLRQNQFGFALTGPVVIPKIYDGHNRTFFLLNYEALRNKQSIPGIETVFTDAMRRGDFSAIIRPIIDPFSAGKTAFPGNIIPTARLSPQSLRILQYLPAANVAGVNPQTGGPANNYNVNVPNSNDSNQTIDRLDQSIGDRVRLFFRYAWQNTELLNGNTNPVNGYTQPVKDRNFVIGYTHTFSPTVVNDARFGRQFVSIDSVNLFADRPNAGTEIGIPGFTTDANNFGLPNIGITDFISVGGQNMASSNWYQTDKTYQFSDVISWNRGAHSISAGYDTRRLITARIANNNPRGGFVFSGTITGYAPADFLLGLPLQVTTPGPLVQAEVGQYRHGFFISDKWQFSKLTLTLGMRYELPTVPKSLNGNATILNPEQTAFIPATVPQSIPLINANHRNFAPRVGFAYRLTPRWVVRGGYGIYYNPNQLNSYTLATTNPPFATIFTYNSLATDPTLTLSNPTPQAAQGALPKPNAFTLNPDLPTAMMNQWSFSVEHGLWRNAGFELQYLGSRTTHLDRSYFNNTPLPGPGNIDARRPNQLFRTIRTIQTDMVSSYQAMSVVVRQQFFKGTTALLSYTWSKTLDVTTDSNGGGAPMDPYNWKLDYGKSNWDIPHRFVGSWTYELPFLRESKMAAAKYVLGGWQVNGILTIQSGYPFNVVTPGDVANTGVGNQRPNLVKAATSNCGGDQLRNCIDASAFVLPPSFTYGNAGRNILRGPGLTNLDFSLFKNFI
ncbi:MAG: TonB-dependent receptor, partial [Bryobacteraceae bacterium]|nr:TonB-dependent receptor [Bryobacteraceae bacterium]